MEWSDQKPQAGRLFPSGKNETAASHPLGKSRVRFYLGAFFCLSLALAIACGSSSSQSTAEIDVTLEDDQSLAVETVEGIDVSHFSGQVDWAQVSAAGKVFAYAKATEGVDYTDPMFADNWDGMATGNIIRGAYHFFVVDDDPTQQAENFMAVVSLGPGDLPPVVDIETPGTLTGEALSANLKTWLEAIEAHYNVKPMIYTNANFWNANLTGDFSAYPLWIAEYDVVQPTLPNGFSAWQMWQYQGDGTVSGVSSDVDLDTFSGDLAALNDFLIKP